MKKKKQKNKNKKTKTKTKKQKKKKKKKKEKRKRKKEKKEKKGKERKHKPGYKCASNKSKEELWTLVTIGREYFWTDSFMYLSAWSSISYLKWSIDTLSSR